MTTATDLVSWYEGIAAVLNANAEAIGVNAAYACYAGEQDRGMPGPAIYLLLDFPSRQAVQPMTNKPTPLRMELVLFGVSGRKSSTRETLIEAIDIVQKAARIIRQQYRGTLTYSDTPAYFLDVSPNGSVIGVVYEFLFSFI